MAVTDEQWILAMVAHRSVVGHYSKRGILSEFCKLTQIAVSDKRIVDVWLG